MKTRYEVETLLYAIPVIVVVLGALVGFALWAALTDGAEEVGGVDDAERVLVVAGELPPLGNEEAPVTIVVFGDYQCQFCEQFTRDTEQRLRAEFVQPGVASLWWRDFAVLGSASVRSAKAARCANEQGMFWQYHDQLYLNQKAGFADEELRLHAERLGLNAVAFDACLASDRYNEIISADQQEGRELGVQGVPTLFINGRKVVGAQPYEVFRAVIEQELER